MVKQIFVNLPVKDLEAAKKFWSALGFSFNPQFTDQNAACLVLGENIYVMLLVPSFFSTFTKKEITNSTKSIEVINAISAESREAINSMMEQVITAGGVETRDPQDYGWMYSRAFEDLDGHLWELVYVDIANAPANPGQAQ